MNWSESTFCSSFFNYDNKDDWIKQLVLTVGKPLSTWQMYIRYIRTIYVYVIFILYSGDTRLRYIYGFYFSSKKTFIYTQKIPKI